MAQGPFTWFQQAELKIANGTILLGSHTFKAALVTSAQTLSAAFNGGTSNCQYSDITAELPTANGYTVGGATLSSVSLTRSGNQVTWTGGGMVWTLTGTGITFKYLVIYDNTATNKDLVCYCDMDTSTGSSSVSPAAGTLTISPGANGILYWTAP